MQYAHVAALPCVLTFGGQELGNAGQLDRTQAHSPPRRLSSRRCAVMVELRTDGTEITNSRGVMIEPGYALFHVLDIPEPCLLHKHLGTEAAKTGPSTNSRSATLGREARLRQRQN